MGDQDVGGPSDPARHQEFVRTLLDELRALERMLDEGRIESGVRRIGSEQEIFLVDRGCRPAPRAMEVLEALEEPGFTTELARFNLEANLPPYLFTGDCLARMEQELRRMLDAVQAAARTCDTDVLLTGILPSLQVADASMENMTPLPRYRSLNDAMRDLAGGRFTIRIRGIDEFYAVHDNVMLESCNTSFQVHLQVGADEFAQLYNLAQAVTAPLLAAAVNSPLLAGRRLWHETRVALFESSVDARTDAHRLRGRPPRVRFGEEWVKESVLEIFREDIARFRILLAINSDEDPGAVLDRGGVPALRALCMHNGTVYRWNRACYGVHEGRAHLRIENRVLPAGPTVADEMANAAFFFGLMVGAADEYGDITEHMAFDDAKENFLRGARHGLGAQFEWPGHGTISASALILETLLPLARRGLASAGIRDRDVDTYLGTLEARVRSGQTGARWSLDSLAEMGERTTRHGRCRALAAATLQRQKTGRPVHTWELARVEEDADWRHSYRTVGQFMTRDLFTVGPDDLVDFAANLMDWKHIRHVPVEDAEGRLVGILSHRTLLRLLAQGSVQGGRRVAVREIMKKDIVCVDPSTSTLKAVDLMRQSKVSCLPVVQDGRLVGILTERDLIDVAAQLLDEHLRELEERE